MKEKKFFYGSSLKCLTFSLIKLVMTTVCADIHYSIPDDDLDPNTVVLTQTQKIMIPPSSAFPYERSLLGNFHVEKGHLYDLRSTLEAQDPTEGLQIVDDFSSAATNETIPFGGFMKKAKTADYWAFWSGLILQGQDEYFMNYYSVNITETRPTQGATDLQYDFIYRHSGKVKYDLNRTIIVFMFKEDSFVVEEFNKIDKIGKKIVLDFANFVQWEKN